MTLAGIDNENGFYPAGFFADTLQVELGEAVARWAADAGTASPARRLATAAPDQLAAIERLRGMTDSDTARPARREAGRKLLAALGYSPRREALDLAGDAGLVPAIARVADADGRDRLWILEAPLPPRGDHAADPMAMRFVPAQFGAEDREAASLDDPIEELLGDGIFGLDRPPRYVIVAGLSQWVLVDRNKWPARAVLRFDLQEIFSRAEPDTLNAMACFLSQEALVPETGVPLADRLAEEAQRHANAVTTSLKGTVREAIETLGQEVLDVTGGKHHSGPRRDRWIDGSELTPECLRYMYRLLFLFYAEANPRLGILDLKDETYARGYSLEALRALENVRLRSIEDREGTYIWDSLQRLLGLLYKGSGGLAGTAAGDGPQGGRAFRLAGVKVSLLDPASTPILSGLRLRNEAMQRIIRLLSLKTGKGGAGRISYAQLGIGQLGAVYETLISFTGFVAKTDLIELRPRAGRGSASDDEEAEDEDDDAEDGGEEDDEDTGPPNGDEDEDDALALADGGRRDRIDPLAPTWFVPRSRASEFEADEIVYDGPKPRIYGKGSFVYRLAGRDREKSASYYTPEPLARLLVKHALMERCRDMTADEILELKILEPAMGSAAFLVETTNQLADLYLERKQAETGRTIPQKDWFAERQKVRAFIADRNCFGVDLNPIAIELGAISLWLNSLHDSRFSPWFGDQLQAGNSLIGARRATYPGTSLAEKKKADLWLARKPEEVGWRRSRPEGHVWQFLLPAKDMAKFDTDKSIAEFAGEAQKRIKAWRKGGFFAKFAGHEVNLLRRLSGIVDTLLDEVAKELAQIRAVSNDAITLWPDREMPGVRDRGFREKARRLGVLTGRVHLANSLPYQRLKTVMDMWCALWLWPLDKAHLLPSRNEYLACLSMILEGGFHGDGTEAAPTAVDLIESPEQPGLFDAMDRYEVEALLKEMPRPAATDLFRETDVDALMAEHEWLQVVRDVAARERFLHFDLVFADILRDRGGFDIIVGNPPWARLGFSETEEIGDLDPGFVIRKMSATAAREARKAILAEPRHRKAYLDAYAAAKGAMAVTGSEDMNPHAGAGRNNLYRCFLDLAFRTTAPAGVSALIHQDGHLTDPQAGDLRKYWYRRVLLHLNFRNQIRSKLFSEVDNNISFSINIYGFEKSEVNFRSFGYAFLPSQIDESLRHDGLGTLPAIKTPDGKWDTRGHRNRIVRVDSEALAVIHALAEDDEVPIEETRFLQPFSSEILGVFKAMAAAPSLGEAVDHWQMSSVWNEVIAQRELRTIRRSTGFRASPEEMVISGPMFHVGNPLYKSPRENCKSNKDYDVVDLTSIPDDYLPRTNYAPAIAMADYRRHLPACRWDPTRSHVDHYRLAVRRRVALNGERSLIPSLIAPGIAHIHAVESVSFKEEVNLVNLAALLSSILYDFFVKISGGGDLHGNHMSQFPWVHVGDTARHRLLRLSSVLTIYDAIWNRFATEFSPSPWSSTDPRLAQEGPVEGPATWDRTAALRTDFARRLALVEIDVLVAQALGLTLEQLIEIYRIYFPVLQQNEAGTWYDRNGRIAWTCSKGLPGVGYLNDKGRSPSRRDWEAIVERGTTRLECVAEIDFLPGGPRRVTRVFEGPFDRCDRVADYRRAWAHFEGLRAAGVAV